MSKRSQSKYSYEDRKRIVELIENLKNNEHYDNAIFEILNDDEADSCTINSNGAFLNMSSISDRTLDHINKYLAKISRQKAKETDIETSIMSYTTDTKSERTYKLSNYEKNILKQRNLKKVLNEDNDYEELRFSLRKQSSSKQAKKQVNKKKLKRATSKKLVHQVTNRS